MSKSGRRRCMFCGAAGSLTKEHIFRRKLAEYVPDPLSPVDWKNFATGEIRTNLPPAFEQQARVVCGACNNGWMNDLENEVEDVLGALIRGEPTELDQAAQDGLCRWGAKTLLVRLRADRSTTPAHLASDFYESGVDSRWTFWVGSYPVDSLRDRTDWRDLSMFVGPETPVDLPVGARIRMHQAEIHLCMGALYFMVTVAQVAVDAPAVSAAARKVVVDGIGGTGVPLVQISPLGPVVTWPPERQLLDAEVDFLRQRFGALP